MRTSRPRRGPLRLGACCELSALRCRSPLTFGEIGKKSSFRSGGGNRIRTLDLEGPQSLLSPGSVSARHRGEVNKKLTSHESPNCRAAGSYGGDRSEFRAARDPDGHWEPA